MKQITSRDNPLYKRVLRLATGKRDIGGDDTRRVVLEGVHLCQAWLQHRGLPELALFDETLLHTHAELQDLAAALRADQCIGLDPRLAKSLSQVEHGQGVYFVVEPASAPVPARIACNSLWLDRIQDPGNIGTLLRTAAAAGIEHAFLSTGCAAAWSPKVLRSAQGAHFVLSISEHLDLRSEARKLAIPAVATALHDAQSLYQTALPAKCAWFFGNEGQGVAPELMALARLRVFIPQVRDVESLNVAVAAGVCLFEQRRQHAAG
ncbi:RNA methyltransferase [Parapusillimonas sp. SGNA-6]|nr:RNA methyltransferase [Parapusillimonas sp. SGNA-6]